ncbi:MAG: peptidoglycan DD-metalloendopeptidase family protein [Syntrophomonadaceae bacterium]|nr:peptidoglycan DD-metalloendopeptidase family protein [Syntrophomonadaceae bacterium]
MNFRKKKKATRQINGYTVLIIPQGTKNPKRMTFSSSKAKVIVGVGVTFVLGLVLIAGLYASGMNDIRRVQTIKQDNHSQADTIRQLNEEIKSLEAQQKELANKQTEIKRLMGISTESRRSTQPSRGGKGGEVAYSIHERNDALERSQNIKTSLNSADKELDVLIAKVKNDQSYFRRLPNQWPCEGEISSTFGWRDSPFGGRSESFHDGLDIANYSGTDVVAAGDGRVIEAGWKPVYGRTIIIDHGAGLTTKYAHNSSILVDEGERIKKGQLIAKMGSSGRSTGPHLHFSVFKGDDPVDPLIYLPDR